MFLMRMMYPLLRSRVRAQYSYSVRLPRHFKNVVCLRASVQPWFKIMRFLLNLTTVGRFQYDTSKYEKHVKQKNANLSIRALHIKFSRDLERNGRGAIAREYSRKRY